MKKISNNDMISDFADEYHSDVKNEDFKSSLKKNSLSKDIS